MDSRRRNILEDEGKVGLINIADVVQNVTKAFSYPLLCNMDDTESLYLVNGNSTPTHRDYPNAIHISSTYPRLYHIHANYTHSKSSVSP